MRLSFEKKLKMRDVLKNKAEYPHKKPKVEEQIKEKKQLWDFVTTNTVSFNTFGISSEFLALSVEEWSQAEGFCVINNLKIVNGVAGTGVKLMKDYNKLLTNKQRTKTIFITSCFKLQKENKW